MLRATSSNNNFSYIGHAFMIWLTNPIMSWVDWQICCHQSGVVSAPLLPFLPPCALFPAIPFPWWSLALTRPSISWFNLLAQQKTFIYVFWLGLVFLPGWQVELPWEGEGALGLAEGKWHQLLAGKGAGPMPLTAALTCHLGSPGLHRQGLRLAPGP